jgi:hypothetical protein
MAEAAIHSPFSLLGLVAGAKLLLPGLPDFQAEGLDRACSLHLEHVSPSSIVGRGISRVGALALQRRPFVARKPDAGFASANFPATLLQSMVST